MYERVVVVGCPASGKSTLSKKLAARTGLPLVGLDELFFGENWSVPSAEDWDRTVRAHVAEPRWVIDGNHAASFEQRLKRAQCVVFTARPPILCAFSYVRRALHLKVTALTTADPSRFPHHMRGPRGVRVTSKPLRFLFFILKFGSVRRQMEQSLAQFPGDVVWVTSFREVDDAVEKVVRDDH